MDRKPFLDKISTAPHIPSQDGQYGLVSLKNFPDLSHTGIRSKFEKQVPYATAKDGTILPSYKANAFKTTRMIERGLVKLNAREDVFKTGHKQFIDKVLCDMESTKQDKHRRQMKHWNSGKGKLGFSDSFNSMSSSAVESFANLPTTDEGLNEDFDRKDARLVKSPTSPASNDGYNDNDFEEHEDAPRSISHQSKSEGNIVQESKLRPERKRSAFAERSMHGVAFSVMCEATTEKRKGSSKGHRSPMNIDEAAAAWNVHSTYKSASAQVEEKGLTKKPSGFNTISMFNSLMEEPPPPSPKKRFGSLAPLSDPNERP